LALGQDLTLANQSRQVQERGQTHGNRIKSTLAVMKMDVILAACGTPVRNRETGLAIIRRLQH
jgi:hypothetical protein